MTRIRLTKTTIGLEVYVDTLPNVTHFYLKFDKYQNSAIACHLVVALE